VILIRDHVFQSDNNTMKFSHHLSTAALIVQSFGLCDSFLGIQVDKSVEVFLITDLRQIKMHRLYTGTLACQKLCMIILY